MVEHWKYNVHAYKYDANSEKIMNLCACGLLYDIIKYIGLQFEGFGGCILI